MLHATTHTNTNTHFQAKLRYRQLYEALQPITLFKKPKIEWEQYATPPEIAAAFLIAIQERYGDVEGKSIVDMGCGYGMLGIGSALLGCANCVGWDIDIDALKETQRNAKLIGVHIDCVCIDLQSFYLDDQSDTDTSSETKKSSKSNGNSIKSQGKSKRKPPPKNKLKFRKHVSALSEEEISSDSEEDDSDSDEATERKKKHDDQLKVLTERLNGLSLSKPSLFFTPTIATTNSASTPIDNSPQPESPPIPPQLFDTVLTNPPFGTRQAGIDCLFVHVGLQFCRAAVYSFHKRSTRPYILRKAQEWGVNCEVVAEVQYNIDASYSFHSAESKDVEVDILRFSFHSGKPRPPRFCVMSKSEHESTLT